jgi:hypothetical protein
MILYSSVYLFLNFLMKYINMQYNLLLLRILEVPGSNMARIPAILTEVYVLFPQSFQANARIVP